MKEIILKVKEPPKRKCQLCGTTENVSLIVGGCFSYLCPKCRKLADKVIRQYLQFISEMPLKLFINTVSDVIESEEDKRQGEF